MNLNLIIGRAKSGKTTKLYDYIDEIRKTEKNANIIFIVPEQMTYFSELDLINKMNLQGIINLQVISFDKLENNVLDEVGRPKYSIINDYGKIMLFKKIFSKGSIDLKAFKGAINKEGFLMELNSLFTEFKRNKISLEALKSLLDEDLDSEILNNKINDLFLIYEEVQKETCDNYYDSEDMTDFFINNIDRSNYIKKSYVFIDNFEGIVQQRINIIEKLIEFSKGVYISTNIDYRCKNNTEIVEDYQVFEVTKDTLKKYEEICNKLDISPNYIICKNTYFKSEMISHLEKNFFKPRSVKYNDEQNIINIFEATNPYDELAFVAKEIYKYVRDNNYRYKDIAIITGDIETYSSNAKKIFSQVGIPLFVNEENDIMGSPFVKYILSMLEISCNNYRREDVINFLKTGLTNISRIEVEDLENYALKYGIDRGRWISFFNKEETETSDNGISKEIGRHFIESYKCDFDRLVKLTNAEAITDTIIKILKERNIEDKLRNKVQKFIKENQNEQASIYSQSWNAIVDTLNQIKLVIRDSKISLREYKKILETGLREIRLKVIPPSLDRVMLGGIDIAYINKYKAIFFVGVNDGVIPKRDDGTGILLEEERRYLIDKNLKIMNSESFRSFKEKHILYKALTNDVEKLNISYAIGSIDGKEMKESYYIDRIILMCSGLKINRIYISSDKAEDNLLNDGWTLNILTGHLRNYAKGKDLPEQWKLVASWFAKNRKDQLLKILEGINYKYKEKTIDEKLIEDLYGENIKISVSRLETYAACPFKFFVEFGLKPMERKNMQVEAYQLGNIYHSAIEKFIFDIIEYIGNKGNSKSEIDVLNDKKVIEIMEKSLNEVLFEDEDNTLALNYNSRYGYVKEKTRKLLNKIALVLAYQISSGNFIPYYEKNDKKFEVEINAKIGDLFELYKEYNVGITGREPYELSEKVMNAKLIGRIDRLDLCKNGDENIINVIDFKSSNKKVDLSMALMGLQIQLFVYLEAAMLMKDKFNNARIGGGFYFSLDEKYIDEKEIKNDLNNENEIENAVKSRFILDHMLNGYASSDKEILGLIDKKIIENHDSNVIDVKFKKGKGDFKESSKVLTQYEGFINEVNKVICNKLDEIVKGRIAINPIEESSKVSSCTYCKYRGICKYDESLKGFHRRKLDKLEGEIKIYKDLESLNSIKKH